MSKRGAEDDGAVIEAGETNTISPAIAESKAKDQVSGENCIDAVVDPNIVDWDSPNDPANPRNWSKKSKMLNTSLISLSVLYSNITTTMYVPGTSELAADFNITSITVMILSITITSLGASLGPLVFAPLSEITGRLPIYWASSCLFIACTIGCALSTNAAMFLIFRFFSGACTASFMTCGGTIADLLPKEERGGAMALFTAGPILGPVVGPVVGGFVTQGWGGGGLSTWFLYWYAGVVTTIAMFTMRETNGSIILAKKTARLRNQTGNPQLRPARSSPQASSSSSSSSPTPRQFAECALLRPLKVLLFSPIVLLTGIYMAFVFGLTYLLFATFPIVFEETYHWSVGVTGLAYLGLGIGCVLGLIILSFLSDRLLKDSNDSLNPHDPRQPCIPIGIFWYAWSLFHASSSHWIVPILGTSLIGMGTIIVSSSAQLYIVDMSGPQAADSALAAFTLIRNASGALLPLAAIPLYGKLGLGWGNSVLGFVTLAFVPVRVVFYRYGAWLRARFPVQSQ